MADNPLALISENIEITLVPKHSRKRVWEIDFLRGVCIILMMLDHLAMLIAYLFGPAWYGRSLLGDTVGAEFARWCSVFISSDTRETVRIVILFIFFSISGISCTFSKSNFKRGVVLAVVAILYSLVTIVISEIVGMDITITFGVLHFYTVCILAYAVIELVCRRSDLLRSLVCLSIALVVLLVYFLYTPPADTPTWLGIVFPPKDFYGNDSLFYSQNDISPGDLFTLIPWSAFFFIGTAIAPMLYARRYSLLPFLDGKWNIPVNFIGKHSIWFFVLHIPVITVILAIVSALFVTPGNWVLF